MKKILKLTTVVFLLTFSFSCENDDSELNIESTIEQEKTIETFKANQVFFPGEVLQSKSAKSAKKIPNLFGCGVTGLNCASPNQTLTYTYANSSINTNATWTIDSGSISISSGQGTNTVNLIFGSNFTGGYVTVSGAGIPNCSVTFEILKCGSGGDGDEDGNWCECPDPVIDDRLCVSGGHPHWRFQVDGISSSDQITWSINHGTIHSNPNQSYVIIEPNSGSTYGFTVYCKVERTCPDGSKKVRTAYYTNYYGNSCGTGTTGFIGSCSGSGEILDDPIF